MGVSLALGIALFFHTFAVQGGFAKSISFDGGIRFGIILPAGLGKPELEEAARKAGFEGVEIRPISQKRNQYDLDLGPEVRDRLLEEAKKHGKHDASATDLTAGIEKRLLSYIPGSTEESIVSRESISASYGDNLFGMAMKSFIITVLMIGIYLTFRFDFPFAIGASLALLHDVVLTVGFIGSAQIEPSIPVLAAVLTIVGYSINDTIVVFDRIRETADENRIQMMMPTTMNVAIFNTLSRTIITSLLTLISVLALLLGGAESLKDFALIMIFGIVVGTYSSIFIASHFVQIYGQFFRSRGTTA